jgi:tRNA nucleotidyltransferase (CCA-adding enzyme)
MTRVPGKSYVVGGAVRDRLLGLPVSDRDHVVVGTTVDAMMAAGFKPVGRDFPVFLHPETHEEYALARTERKVARGYAGFVFHADPSVTLEADLERRDLTINAMAEDEDGGALIDPFGGRRDLDAHVFRHVGPAFAEDPVRVLRLARFAARFDRFDVAPETLALARSMVASGEIDALVPERVWQEWARGLMEHDPVRMFDVLEEVGALSRLLPARCARDSSGWRLTAAALKRAADDNASLEVRFAVTLHAVEGDDPVRSIEAWCERFAVPRAARDLALLVKRYGTALGRALADGASDALVDILERTDAFRRRGRFSEMIAALSALLPKDRDRSIFLDALRIVLGAVDGVDIGAIARDEPSPSTIPLRIRAARDVAIRRALSRQPPA